MIKYIDVHNWTTTFRELLANRSRCLDIKQYDYCLNEWKSAHDKKAIANYVLTIVVFCVGLWAVWESAFFMSVLLLALAVNFNRQSSHHMLVSELMGSQRLLAMLINKQSMEIESLRNQLSDSLDAQEDDYQDA